MLSTRPPRSLPLGIGILGVLLILAGLFDLASGLTRVVDLFAFNNPNLALLFGLVYVATGIGFLKPAAFTWYLGLALSSLDIIRRIVLVGYGYLLIQVPGIFVELVIIFYLLEPRVQQYFGLGKQA